MTSSQPGLHLHQLFTLKVSGYDVKRQRKTKFAIHLMTSYPEAITGQLHQDEDFCYKENILHFLILQITHILRHPKKSYLGLSASTLTPRLT